MTPLAILREARKLLTDPKRWRQGNYFWGVGEGRCMCLMGAVQVAAGARDVDSGFPRSCYHSGPIDGARALLREVTGARVMEAWNDRRGRRHSTVLRKLDAAIALAEAA